MPPFLSDRESSHGGEPLDSDRHHGNRRVWHKISWLGTATLVLGTVVLLGAFGLLLFISIEASRASNDEYTSPEWDNIAFSGWTTRVVTICTAAMRVAISSQAAVSMAMIAALFLETAGATTFNVPALSLYRATSPSPLSLLGHLRFNNAAAFMYSVLVLLTAGLAVVSQFASTILLSDFGNVNITRVFEAQEVPYLSSVYSTNSNYLTSPPSGYWRFAEKTEPPVQKEGFVDTGPTIRAAIPWRDESRRLRLKSYAGPTVVFDTRAFCVRPNLANVTFGPPFSQLPYLKGNITLDNDYLPMKRCRDGYYECNQEYDKENPWVVPFACAQGSVQYSSSFGSLGSTSICDIPVWHQPTFPSWVPAANRSYNRAFGVVVSHQLDNFEEYDEPDYENLVMGDRGAWKTLAQPDGRQLFSVSLCFSKQGLLPANVTISGFPAQAEPALRFVPNPARIPDQTSYDTGTIDTLAIRRYLGATDEGLSLRDRGILSLDSSRPLRDDVDSMMDGLRLGTNKTLLVGSFNNGVDETPNLAPERTAAVVHDILKTTDNPAYAIQALATQVYLMQYYGLDFAFDTAGAATYAMVESVLIPVRRAGLYGILAVLLLHLAVVAAVLALFLARTRDSLIGNFWQAVAQVVSDDTAAPLLRRAHGLRDSEVEAVLAAYSQEKGVLRERNIGRRDFSSS